MPSPLFCTGCAFYFLPAPAGRLCKTCYVLQWGTVKPPISFSPYWRKRNAPLSGAKKKRGWVQARAEPCPYPVLLSAEQSRCQFGARRTPRSRTDRYRWRGAKEKCCAKFPQRSSRCVYLSVFRREKGHFSVGCRRKRLNFSTFHAPAGEIFSTPKERQRKKKNTASLLQQIRCSSTKHICAIDCRLFLVCNDARLT